MSKVLRGVFHTVTAVLAAATLMAAVAPALADSALTTQTGKASDAFPGLQKFLNLQAADRSQVNVYYNLRIKHCDATLVRATLNANGKSVPLTIARDGRITPLPTRDQLNQGASLTMTMPAGCTIGPKIKVYSTQPAGRTFDAAGLSLGIRQGNSAMSKIAGPLAMTLKKLDRVYFVGGGDGTVEAGGRAKPLPKTTGASEYPVGTPYFVPSDNPGAGRISLSRPATIALFDTPAK